MLTGNTKQDLFSDQELLEILHAAPVGTVVSRPDGSFVYVNNALMEMLGYTEEEIYQSDLLITHPDEKHIGYEMRRQVLDNPEKAVVMEKRYQHKDGHYLLGLTSMRGIRDNDGKVIRFVAQIIDIGYRKKIEKSADLFRTMVNASREAMYIIEPSSGKILDANIEACNSLGYSYEEILNLNILEIESSIFDEKDWGDYVRKLRQEKHLLLFGEHLHKDRHKFPVEVSFGYLVQENFEYLLAIVRDITERVKSEEVIWRQANYDMLTGLPNRNMLHDRLEQGLKKARREKYKIAVLCLDLDKFKDVNDTMGHPVGDKLLKEVGCTLHGCVRQVDTVARLGGDEFCIVVEQVEETENINRIANSILHSMSRPFVFEDNRVFTSASIGIAFYPDDASTVADLLKKSDQAMYFAKNKGRNCFQYFTESMQQKALDRMQLSRDIHDALQRNEFFVQYQPIVSLADNQIHKAEALLRWRHPQRGLLSPDIFIAIAEENATICHLGDFVFEETLKVLKIWRSKISDRFQISVNTSPLQYREGQSQLHQWQKKLTELQLPGDSLLVEITEGMIMDTDQGVMEKLLMMRDAGIQVALDDFGTGYSSLAYLQKLDIDYLKIDRSFIKNLKPKSNEAALCEAIIVMAHRLNLYVVAEGIETQEQLNILKAAGCDYGQGFLFSRPLDQKEFEAFINKQC